MSWSSKDTESKTLYYFIRVGVEANNDHRFVIVAYMNYFRVSKFLMNSDTRSSYLPKPDVHMGTFVFTFTFTTKETKAKKQN